MSYLKLERLSSFVFIQLYVCVYVYVFTWSILYKDSCINECFEILEMTYRVLKYRSARNAFPEYHWTSTCIHVVYMLVYEVVSLSDKISNTYWCWLWGFHVSNVTYTVSLVPSHHRNQWWLISNWTLNGKFYWKYTWNIVCKITLTLSRRQCVI